MAGDLHVNEWAVLEGEAALAARPEATGAEGHAIHRYGRVSIIAGPEAEAEVEAAARPAQALTDVEQVEEPSLTERLGLQALRLRGSDEYAEAKAQRPRDGQEWDMRGCTDVVAPPPEALRTPRYLRQAAQAVAGPEAGAALAAAEEWTPTSDYLEGSVAVGLVIVEGPTPELTFSNAERLKIVAEVQNGLGWFAASNPLARISFVYDINVVTLDVLPDPTAEDREGLWRNPALAAMGYEPDWTGVDRYVRDLRDRLGTRWTFCGFVTRYPLDWFAYAYMGGPYIVTDYDLDGWGVDNMDRVFAHETGHIFNCPDEYASSGCTCGDWWGRFRLPNGNCENCAPGGGTACLMKVNDFVLCEYTEGHLGWSVTAPLFVGHSGKVLDVAQASTANRAPVLQYDWKGGANQRWRLEAVGDGCVRAVAQHSGKVLDVERASTAEGAPVLQYDWHNTANQRWRFEFAGYSDDVRLTALHSGKVLDIDGSSTALRAPAVQRTWIARHSQRWRYRNHPIAAKHSGRVMSATGLIDEQRAKVVQCAYFNGDNQYWLLQPRTDGYVVVTSMRNGMVLDVERASTADGARIIQFWETGGDNQLFRPEPIETGCVRLVAKHSGKVVEVAQGATSDGAAIVQATWDGGDNQRWRV